MSTEARSPAKNDVPESPENKGKGKGKAVDTPKKEEEEEEDDDDDEEEEGEEEEEEGDDEDEEEGFEEIDPSAIRPRRTRGVRVDYTSKEALKKAGLTGDENEDDDDDDDVKMQD